MQRTVYNGHKCVHAIKFQAIATPNGLVANLFGPVEGRRHDSGMLADSAILPLLEQYSINQNGNHLCIYGDLAYTIRLQLQTPFSKPPLNPQQAAYNTGAHLGFLEGRGLKFRKRANHYKTKKKRI